jgi:DNA modification methylase
MQSGNSDAAEMLRAMRSFLKENDMMAYLIMMAVRLLELHRVLKPTGSLYLHCDPTASHYLKILLDAVFGKANFINEIIWERTNSKSHAYTRFSSSHDVIFYFSKITNLRLASSIFASFCKLQEISLFERRRKYGTTIHSGRLPEPESRSPESDL